MIDCTFSQGVSTMILIVGGFIFNFRFWHAFQYCGLNLTWMICTNRYHDNLNFFCCWLQQRVSSQSLIWSHFVRIKVSKYEFSFLENKDSLFPPTEISSILFFWTSTVTSFHFINHHRIWSASHTRCACFKTECRLRTDFPFSFLNLDYFGWFFDKFRL